MRSRESKKVTEWHVDFEPSKLDSGWISSKQGTQSGQVKGGRPIAPRFVRSPNNLTHAKFEWTKKFDQRLQTRKANYDENGEQSGIPVKAVESG